ncbi:GNAT family N-acetyltransferase [Haliangium sp.]|uniref:GNAT family N-acetyltransferase n=1 Tax=Haliangium sp. TaxID=2663208 RepID=UPI003D0FE5E4
MDDTLLFETERLVARPWRLDDAPAAFCIYGDPEVARYIGGHVETSVEGQRQTLSKILARFEGTPFGSWPLIEKAGGALVGTILLKPLPDRARALSEDIEIGWHLARTAWGRGYATEAGRACLGYAFGGLRLELVHAVVEPPNRASQAVCRRLGMDHHGRTQRYYGGIELEHFTIAAQPAPVSEPERAPLPPDAASDQQL